MDRKLTRDRIFKLWTQSGILKDIIDELEADYHADILAARDETRAEVLKDHFAFGEEVIVTSTNGERRCRFYPTFRYPGGGNDWFIAPELTIRRVNMRPMNREELKAAASQLDETTLRDAFTEDAARTVLTRAGISTEVPE